MGAVPTVSPSIFATPLPVTPADPYWSGFGAGVWVTLGIVAALIVAFVIGRYLELPHRVRKPRAKIASPGWYDKVEGPGR